MISLEHFLLGTFNNLGFRLYKSPQLSQTISESALIELCRQGGGLKKEIVRIKPYPHEPTPFIAVTYLKPTTDEYNRSGAIWNHTIIIRYSDVLKLIDFDRLMAPHFIRHQDEPPESPLEPIKLEPIELVKE